MHECRCLSLPFADLVPEAPANFVYVPNTHICLFQSKLYNIDTAGGLGVLIVGGDSYAQYQMFGSSKHLPLYLQRVFAHPMLQICISIDRDIRSIVRAEFGKVDEIIVTEVLELSSNCENGRPFNVKYFGRSARLIFNNSAAGECVLGAKYLSLLIHS